MMFRQEEIFVGGWQDKTMEAMQRRRFDTMVAQLSPLGAKRLQALTPHALKRRIEGCWQEIERKPMRNLQLAQIKERVLSRIQAHADCLSKEEHNLVERALILGGSAQIEDAQELEAAQALSLRLWASVGIASGKPYIELEHSIMQPAAVAMAREEHEQIRRRFEEFNANLSALLYRAGAIDDRLPQQMILRDVLQEKGDQSEARMLARRYLWSSCDCVDYGGGVMLLHPALAEPRSLLSDGRRRSSLLASSRPSDWTAADILPQEIPLQLALERAIEGSLRDGRQAKEVARDIRFLCKQGAPLAAMTDVLQSSLIVLVNPAMHFALESMFYMTPKWIESARLGALQ